MKNPLWHMARTPNTFFVIAHNVQVISTGIFFASGISRSHDASDSLGYRRKVFTPKALDLYRTLPYSYGNV